MPNRILREGILTSERVSKLSWPAEVFYRRLMSAVDDFGRYYANPTLLRAVCYPLQLEKVSDADIAKWIRETEEAALVSVYPAEDGKRYLEMLDFRQQVRAKNSKFPASNAQQMSGTCIADAQQAIADAHLDVVVDGDEVDKKPRRAKRSGMPSDFGISPGVRAWAEREGFGSLETHLAYFRDYASANGKTYADWDAALKNCIRGNWAKVKTAAPAADAPWKGAK